MNAIPDVFQFAEAKYSLAAPIEDAIAICKGKLCAANYAVVQIGHSKLVGCKPGDAQQFVEVMLEQSASTNTEVVFCCHATWADPSTPLAMPLETIAYQ